MPVSHSRSPSRPAGDGERRVASRWRRRAHSGDAKATHGETSEPRGEGLRCTPTLAVLVDGRTQPTDGSAMSSGSPAAGRLTTAVAAHPPGVYRWRSRAHPSTIRRELKARNWACHVLDGRIVTSAGALFDDCARLLAFPTWFGRTWDAFTDCLVDLSWLPEAGHLVLWERYGILGEEDLGAWTAAREVFTVATATRHRLGLAPLYVLLRGVGPGTDLPVL